MTRDLSLLNFNLDRLKVFLIFAALFRKPCQKNNTSILNFLLMTPEKIINDLKKSKYTPVYWLEGEEDYFIDQVIYFAEHNILSESEAGFNLTIFYGRDTDWAEVVNACRRYPMFAEKQVVIIKEAQDLKSIDKLESYVEKPLASTLLFVAYKNKKVDGRTKLARLLKDKAALMTTKKIYDNALPEWTSELVKAKGYTITKKSAVFID